MGKTTFHLTSTGKTAILDSPLRIPSEVTLRDELSVRILVAGALHSVPDSSYKRLFEVLIDITGAGLWAHLDTVLALLRHNYVDCKHPEYIYLCNKIHPFAADFGARLLAHNTPFDMMQNISSMDVPTSIKLETAIYYSSFDIGSIFNESNTIVIKRLNSLKAQQRSTGWLVDMHNICDYFTYTPPVVPIWECKTVNSAGVSTPGESTINTFEKALDNLNEFAHGKLLSDNSVVIAGGSIAKVLDTRYNTQMTRPSDLDMFIIGSDNEVRLNTYKRVLSYFAGPGTYYAIHGSVTTIYIVGLKRKYQIISHNVSTPYELMLGFDLTYIQCCYWNGRFYATPMCCKSLKERCAYSGNIRRLRIDRLIKCLYFGYDIAISKDLSSQCDIEDMIKDKSNPQLKKIIRDMHKYYYPIADESADPEFAKMHIMSMIETDSKGSIITDNESYALSNMLIGGNFENNYESTMYTNFNPNSLNLRPVNNRTTTIPLRTRHGSVVVTSSALTVTSIANSDDENPGIKLSAIVDGGFADFITNTLENVVFRLYHKSGITRSLITDNKITIHIPQYKVTQQATRGCLLKTNHGEPLLIEEDLSPEDVVQIMFMLSLSTFPALKCVNIHPIKIIKWVKDEDTSVDTTIASGEVTDASNYDGVIVYED